MNLPDLTGLSDFELHKRADKEGLPDYVTLKRAQKEQQAAKAAAEAQARADEKARERSEAERKARTFTDARDQLDRLGRTPAVADIGAVDGPKVNAILDHVAELDRQHELARQEALRMLDGAISGWNSDYAVRRDVEDMRREAAASQGAAFLITNHFTKNWHNAMTKLASGFLGWKVSKVNRKRSRHGE